MNPMAAYKICPKSLWESQILTLGKFVGSDLDAKDGFIHLSAKSQLRDTANKWFKGQKDLILICVDLSRVHGEVKWEPSRNNELFPHIYGFFDNRSVVWLREFHLTTDHSGFVYPPEIDAD